jgi:hypothetical protein
MAKQKLTDMDLECMECGSSVDLLFLTLTNDEGNEIDKHMICKSCAIEHGFSVYYK